jgi:RuvB-like protein 1
MLRHKPTRDRSRCMIVKTDGYNRDQVGKVVGLRANVEGLRLGAGVLERLALEGEKTSLRYVPCFIAC